MKKLKKVTSLILALVMLMTMFVGCGSKEEIAPAKEEAAVTQEEAAEGNEESSGDSEELPSFKIGVAVGTWNEKALMTQYYYDEYLAPAFNVEFVWAEETKEVSALLNFIDTLASVGADALIDFSGMTKDQLLSVGAKCTEYGIWYVNNNAQIDEGMPDFEYYGGTFGANPATVGEQFYEMTEHVINDGEAHNVIIPNGWALVGVEQHNISSAKTLEALCSVYDLELENNDYYEVVTTTTSTTELETGTDMKIALEPSNPPNPDSFYALLKDGEYDVIIFQTPQYTLTESVVQEVEEAYGMNIRIISIAPVAETTYNSFATPDASGNQALDAALIKNNSAGGAAFAMAYNCLTGHKEDMLINGAHELLDAPMWTCYDLETYENLAQLDAIDGEYFTYRVEDVKEMLFEFNPDLTAEKLFEIAASVLDAEMVLERNGL